MPFGLVPTFVAMQIAVIEYGIHRWDLERTCGDPNFDLPSDIAAASIAMIPGLLPMLAAGSKAPPSAPIAVRLRSDVATHTLAFDGVWAPVKSTVLPTCTIDANASDLTMFYIGRLDAHAAGITIDGSLEAAERFKQYFPGP